MTKQEFIKEIEFTMEDVRDYQDCIDWWGSMIDAYIEDGELTVKARSWKNPFLSEFEG